MSPRESADCCADARLSFSTLRHEAPSALYPLDGCALPTEPRWLWETLAYAEGTTIEIDVEVMRCRCGAELPR